jgi:hypothetical protein
VIAHQGIDSLGKRFERIDVHRNARCTGRATPAFHGKDRSEYPPTRTPSATVIHNDGRGEDSTEISGKISSDDSSDDSSESNDR